jgi:hypothetical protein
VHFGIPCAHVHLLCVERVLYHIHMSLRTEIFVVLFLISALTSLGKLSVTADSSDVSRLLGTAVGVSAGVEPNEYSALAQALRQKQEGLALTESDLARREALVREAEAREEAKSDRQLLYLFILTGGLFLLVLANFYFDIRRSHMMLASSSVSGAHA